MKKTVIILLVLALLTVGVSVAIAAEADDERLEWHEEMLKFKQEQLDEMVEEGLITQEEADAFIERMEENYESGYCNGPFGRTGEGESYGFRRGSGRGGGFGCHGGFTGN